MENITTMGSHRGVYSLAKNQRGVYNSGKKITKL